MSGFTAAQIEKLDFDFTGIPCASQPVPSESGPGAPAVVYCRGKGVVPEPTVPRLGRFLDYIAEGRRTIRDAIKAAQAGEETGDPQAASEQLHDSLNGVRAALADFCNGTPSADEIDELPPRALSAFFRWLAGEFLPKG